MIILILFCVFILFLNEVYLNELMWKDLNNYGPYDVEWSRYEICRGPKAINVTSYNTSLRKVDDSYLGVINYTFLIPTKFDEIKITIYSIKGNRKNLLWNYKMRDACQHYAFAAAIEKELHANNCLVKKGTYICSLNFTEIAKTFFGTSFFYGEYMLKVVSWSSKGNILCLINQIFKKKSSI